MKKTLITLMALAGMASAADISASLTSTGWTTGSLRNRAAITVNTDTGTATLQNSNWGQAWANYSFVSWDGDSYAMGQDSSLSFSLVMTPKNMSLSSLFFIETTDSAFVMGKDYDEVSVSYGKGVKHDAPAYAFATDLDGNTDTQVTDQNRITGGTDSNSHEIPMFVENTPLTLSGTVSWDGDSYSMSLIAGEQPAVTWDLGVTDFNIRKIGLYGDGANVADNVEISNLSVSATNVTLIPEPATATLSLLALAGLAARRRRR